MPNAPLTNLPEYTVSELSGAVKRTLEGTFGRVRVRGEITELKRYASGHIYFALKDEGGKIKAVAWKFSVPRLGLAPEDGVEVIATGKISAYGERSEYQLIIDRLEYAGAGALLARVEMLRQKLAAEGLFAEERKRALPMLPAVVGVVTSPQGAVIQDIRTTILRRFPRPILLWPVPVQGEGAAARIAAAIEGFSALPAGGPIPRPDVLIVARGGGSLEDLMAFNDEAVVRAAAACTIPLISAVGHETDTTLIDHAADRRAPTPTAAAELAVPSRAGLRADLQQTAARLTGAASRLLQERRLRLQRAERGLPDLAGLLGTVRQRLDDRAARLGLAMPHLLHQRRAQLVDAERHLPDPTGLLANARLRLRDQAERLALGPPNLLQKRRAKLLELAARLPDPTSRLASARQLLREQNGRLTLALPNVVRQRRARLVDVERHLIAPTALLAAKRAALALLETRRHAAMRRMIAARPVPRISAAPLRAQVREARARLEGLAARLDSVSHHAVLARGYAAVFDAAGQPLTTAAAVKPGAALRIDFADGAVRATAARRDDKRQGALPL